MREKLVFTTSVIVALFIGIIGTIIVYSQFSPILAEGGVVEKTVKNISLSESDTIASSIEKVSDAVVYIESFSGNRQISSGTGFVYKKDNNKGYIITNNHVVEKATKIEIVNAKGQRVEATVLGTDVFSDIAVLSIQKDAVIVVAEKGDSVASKIGDTVFTVGSPLGIEYMNSVTKGILSGKDRTVEVSSSNGEFLMELLQIDAAINPGNSGGPLCNINGEVIGVNSLKLVENTVEGMGFAIPIELVMASVVQLEQGKEVKRPMIGVELADVSNTWDLYQNNIQLDSSIKEGIVIVSASKDYPAAATGLQKGDVLIELDDVKIKSIAHFRFLLYKHSIGDKVKVKYISSGKTKNATLVLNKSIN